MSLTKLSLAGNNLTIPGQGEYGSDISVGDGKISNIFLQCKLQISLIVWKMGEGGRKPVLYQTSSGMSSCVAVRARERET